MTLVREITLAFVLVSLVIRSYSFRLSALKSTLPKVINVPRWRQVTPRETARRVLPPHMCAGETEMEKTSEGDREDYSASPAASYLGKFLPKERGAAAPQAKDLVFNTGSENKRRGLSVDEMTAAVEEGLIRHGWFVTGRVDASLFSDDFLFEDPQVSRTGVEKYAESVARLLDQKESRCDVISAEAEEEDIVVRWRLSGRLNLPFKPPIKPYIVTTKFERDGDGLICRQRDEYSIASWDILLQAIFPGHPFGAAPAPPVPPRT